MTTPTGTDTPTPAADAAPEVPTDLAPALAEARAHIEHLEHLLEVRDRGPRVSQADVQASLAITALVELHRTTTSGSPQSFRGGGATPYLDAARHLGDQLVGAILATPEKG